MKKILGFAALVIGAALYLPAPPQAVPEINPTSASSAIALLAGGLLLLRTRRK